MSDPESPLIELLVDYESGVPSKYIYFVCAYGLSRDSCQSSKVMCHYILEVEYKETIKVKNVFIETKKNLNQSVIMAMIKLLSLVKYLMKIRYM